MNLSSFLHVNVAKPCVRLSSKPISDWSPIGYYSRAFECDRPMLQVQLADSVGDTSEFANISFKCMTVQCRLDSQKVSFKATIDLEFDSGWNCRPSCFPLFAKTGFSLPSISAISQMLVTDAYDSKAQSALREMRERIAAREFRMFTDLASDDDDGRIFGWPLEIRPGTWIDAKPFQWLMTIRASEPNFEIAINEDRKLVVYDYVS